MIKVAAVVILYHPEEAVFQNINTYYPFVQKVYVFDNTEQAHNSINWKLYPKVEYYHDHQNKGIAERLNSAATKAIEDGYEWLLTMDQDSKFLEEAMKQYLDCFSNFTQKEKVALFGPTQYEEHLRPEANCQWMEAERIITSGSLLNLFLFQKIGKFDEALFIDSVDFDYCIRVRLAGYRIVQFSHIGMTHQLGTMVHRSSIKTLFLVKKNKTLHSPLRVYYMLRNLLYLKKKYPQQQLPVLKKIEHEVKDKIKNCFLYGRDTKKLFQYAVLAIKDFRNNKMGKQIIR